ncbi:MAG TPA: OmpA family protein [Polyangia bacterium]|jgi:outer membrane protein OmpA-like peptidoglycan-associated protein|nr:OmpA family protein [Polyangia bacterium]
MRTPRCHLIAMLLPLAAVASPGNATPATTATAPRASAGPPLRMSLDKSKVDLKRHRLELTMSQPAGKVSIKVTGESGATLAEEDHDFAGHSAGSLLVVTWNPVPDEPVSRIEVRATDARGYYVGVELSPWFVPLPHDEVNFRTGSADIDDSERPKLEAAYAELEKKLAEIAGKDKDRLHRNITLFIAGHTDTVAGAAFNLKLSQARARSIAGWFRTRGARIPIAYEGFGETSLLVPTADQVDEPRNRRTDYFLAEDAPALKTTGFKPAWKRTN